MDLLDRLRPRWRHADPEIRAAAVREMEAGDQERLATIADGDPDARVRRLAIKKVDDPAVLDRVAAGDADPALRELAAECARDVRVRIATSDAAADRCEAALAALQDERALAQVAVAATHDTVRRAALARVSGDRPLRDVVRGATDPDVRRAALERIVDVGVLRAIAVGDGPADVVVLAVERIADVEVLRAIADTRTASKAARQRAQAMLPADERPATGGRDVRGRQLALCTIVEGLRKRSDVVQAASQARDAQHEWQALSREGEPRPEVAERFEAACRAVLERADSLARRHAEVDHARDAVAHGLDARAALCDRVETLEGDGAIDALAAARDEWKTLAPLPEADTAALARRFRAAGDACVERHERWSEQSSLQEQLAGIVQTAETLANAGGPPATKAWRAVERRWNAHEATRGTVEGIEALEARYAAAAETLARRREDAAAQRGELERENLTRLGALCTRLESLASGERLKPTTARRELQVAESTIRDLGPLPQTERRGVWTQRLTAARDALARRASQDAETEEWRRWANAGAQEALIARVEELTASEDLAEATRQLGGLQDEWAAIATASPDKSQALWERFRAAREQLRRRCDVYMAENLTKKQALVAQTAGVAESTDWNATADLVRRLQAEWKAIGPVPPRHSGALWRQFREPCDRFFARRKDHFGRIDAERSENAARKIALCEKAEALADSREWDETAEALKQLQTEWKRTGPPPRDKADQLWNRFRSACDRFFDRSKRRDELERDELIGKADALCVQLETLAASLDPAAAEAPDDAQVGQTVDGAWADWLKLDVVTLDAARPVRERLEALVQRIAEARPSSMSGTRLDPETTRARRETLCTKMEALVPSAPEAPKALSLQEMAMALRDRLASNTIVGQSGGKSAGKSGGKGAAKGGGKGAPEPVKRDDGPPDGSRLVASWARLGPALDDAARALAERFERARGQVRPS
jgi:hypothetical protein